MPRTYTIELTDPEVAMIERVAAIKGQSADQVVGLVLRARLFDYAVALTDDTWSYQDEVTGEWRPDPDQQQESFEALMPSLLGSDSGTKQ